MLSALAISDSMVLIADFLNNYLKFYLNTYLLGHKVGSLHQTDMDPRVCSLILQNRFFFQISL